MKRPDAPSVESALVTVGVLALVVVLLASFRALPTGSKSTVVRSDDGQALDAGGGATADGAALADPSGSAAIAASGGSVQGSKAGGGTAGQAGTKAATGSATGVAPGAQAGCHGGSTDTGVSSDSIKLGATIVDSGLGSSFLGPVRIGMTAVANQVNRSGGICGRKLDLKLKDDGWDRQRGRSFIQNLVEDEKVFGLAVVPSSEGLDAAADYLEQKGVPVVGTDGMLASQYTHSWIWSVATSTTSLMHIIAKDAADRGAKNFSLVYDNRYRFGLEGAYAYNQAVKRLTGSDIPGYQDPFSNG